MVLELMTERSIGTPTKKLLPQYSCLSKRRSNLRSEDLGRLKLCASKSVLLSGYTYPNTDCMKELLLLNLLESFMHRRSWFLGCCGKDRSLCLFARLC